MNGILRSKFGFLIVSSIISIYAQAATDAPPKILTPFDGSLIVAAPTELYARSDTLAESIEFFANNVSLGGGFSSPGLNTVKLTWLDPQPGQYEIVAVARALPSGVNRTSAPVVVQIVPPDLSSSFGLWFFSMTNYPRIFLQSFTLDSGATNSKSLFQGARVFPNGSTSPYYYGFWSHQVWRVSTQTGAAEVWLSTGMDSEMGSVTAVAGDFGRLFVLDAGALYVYQNGVFGRFFLGEIPDHGKIRGMVYHRPDDSLYILDHDGQMMSRYSAQGSFISSFGFPLVPVRENLRIELVSVGDQIAVLSETEPTAPGAAIQSFIQVVDPAFGKVRLTYVGAHVSGASAQSNSVGAQPVRLNISTVGDAVQLKQDATGVLEESRSLTSPAWIPVGEPDKEFRISLDPADPARFYRTRMQK